MDKLAVFVQSYINVFKWNDLVDITIMAFVIYWLFKLIRETRAVQLLKGILIILVATQISVWFDLNVINFFLTNALQVGLLAFVVVFQPELRRALEQVGTTKIGDLFFKTTENNEEAESSIVEICEACAALSRLKMGALIVIERKTNVGDIILTGKLIESKISAELLINIFYPNTPLHDGAVLKRNNKIKAAGCLLPLSQNKNLSSELGTRHRAAIGMSENSDAIIVVVSEETGKISIAKKGTLTRNYTGETLKRALEKSLLSFEVDKKSANKTVKENKDVQ